MSGKEKKQQVSYDRTKSLGKGIIIPVFAIALLLFSGLVVVSNYTSSKRALEIQKNEARSIAHAIAYAAQTVPNLTQLNRFVSSLGGHPQIKSIHVIDDYKDSIIASTDFVAIGSTVSKFRTLTLSAIDRDTLNLPVGSFHSDDSHRSLSFSDQVDLSRWEQSNLKSNYGRVIITIDRRIADEQVSTFSHINTAVAALCVVLLLACILALVKKQILHPLQRIENGLIAHFKEDTPFRKPNLPNNEIGHIAGLLEKTFDTILEQKHQATELSRHLQFQKDTLDLHAIVSETNEKGEITYANEAFCEISGFTWEEIAGKNHRILNSSLHPFEFWKHMYREVVKKGYWNGEVRNRAKDGSFYWVNTSIAAFKNDKGKIERFVSIRTDITALKEAEFKMIKANAEIERSLEIAQKAQEEAEYAANAKSQFLATMSHEIRTPMNGMIGVLHLMEEDLPAEKVELLQTAKNSANDLLVLINDILDFSKIEAGKMELEAIEFDGLDLIENICDLHATTAHNKQLDLVIESDPNVVNTLKGDPVRIRQIVSNLIGNAIKFTEKGFVSASIELKQSHYRISITDTGIGINSDSKDQLFESFTQENSSTSRKFGGTGLGLSICKKLVELMNGRIWVESLLGHGSCFSFEIPRDGPIQQCKIGSTASTLRDKNVLLVNLDSHTRIFLERHLDHWDANTYLWNNMPSEAPKFDVVVLDPSRLAKEKTPWESIRPKLDLTNEHILVTVSGVGSENEEIVLDEPVRSLTKPIHASRLLTALTSQKASKTENRGSKTRSNSFSKLKILVVDDNFTNRLIATKMMKQRHSIDADSASSGEEAIEMITNNSYDIIFMDCMMPDMDGYTATRLLREGKAGKDKANTPIIALTANVMSGDREKCEEAGMDDYIAKPIDPTDIARILETWNTKKKQPEAKPTKDKSSPLDIDKLTALYKGNQSDVHEVLTLFVECMQENMKQLQQAILQGDTEEDVRFYAHRIRGSAAEIGASNLSKISASMEEFCLSNQTEEAAKLFPEISSEVAKVESAITAYFKG